MVLKCIYMPLTLVYGGVTLVLHALWHFGYVQTFSNAGFFVLLLHVIIIGIPTTAVPVITRLRRLPVSVRMALTNILFAAACMLVPIISAHRVWRRQYKELNGLLFIHEFMPLAPPRVRPALVLPHEPLSICDDDMFFPLAMVDHGNLLMSNFMLWSFIELPPKYFAFSFAAHILHFWFSAHRVTAVYGEACIGSQSYDSIRQQWQPVIHMVHVISSVSYVLTRHFMISRDRDIHKLRACAFFKQAVSVSKVHLYALLRINSQPPPVAQPRATFWSRTEFLLSCQPEEQPLLLPATVGIALRVCARLKDCAIYVVALGLPIFYTFLEFMRHIIPVDARVCSAFYLFFFKAALVFVFMTLPHTLVSKSIMQRRIWSPRLVLSLCAIATVVVVQYLRPGSMGCARYSVLHYVFVTL